MTGVSFTRDFFHAYTFDYGLSPGSSARSPSSIFFARYLLPAGEDMFGQIKQFSHISAVDLVEVGLIWKSTSSYIENCFQKFVGFKIDWNVFRTKSLVFVKKSHSSKKMQFQIFDIRSPQVSGEAKGYSCKNIQAPPSEIFERCLVSRDDKVSAVVMKCFDPLNTRSVNIELFSLYFDF